VLALVAALASANCVSRHDGARPPRAWLALLDCIDEQALSQRLAGRLVCVDPAATEPGVRPDGCLALPTDWHAASRADHRSARRLTARMAHLTLHRADFGVLDATAQRDCASWVATRLDGEARALDVEARVRQKLGVPFAPGEADLHLASLAAAYAARCRDARPLP
jgi:hypothetical protein